MPFEFNGATISCREFTIADDDAILRFSGKFPDGAIVNSSTPFSEFMIGAVVDGDSPVPMVTPSSPLDDVAAAYAAWGKLPRRFLRLWRDEVESVENPAPKA